MAAEHARQRHTGVVIFGAQRPGVGSAIEIRAFAPADGIPEDPVCGSGTASVAAVIRQSGQTGRFGKSFVASQGRVVGRAGFLRVDLTDALRVGGNAVTCIEGVITLPES
jgi:PhzF family phenazine biosynthesis protein